MNTCRVCLCQFTDDCDGLHVALYGVCCTCAHRMTVRKAVALEQV